MERDGTWYCIMSWHTYATLRQYKRVTKWNVFTTQCAHNTNPWRSLFWKHENSSNLKVKKPVWTHVLWRMKRWSLGPGRWRRCGSARMLSGFIHVVCEGLLPIHLGAAAVRLRHYSNKIVSQDCHKQRLYKCVFKSMYPLYRDRSYNMEPCYYWPILYNGITWQKYLLSNINQLHHSQVYWCELWLLIYNINLRRYN